MIALVDKLLQAPEPAAAQERVAAARRRALKGLMQVGLPTTRHERWKYTSLKLLERREYDWQLPGEREALLQRARDTVAELPSSGLVVFGGGQLLLADIEASTRDALGASALSGALQDAPERALEALEAELENPDDGFAWLSLSRAADGLLLDVNEGVQIEHPLHIVYAEPEDSRGAWNYRHHWRLGAGSGLKLVEHHLEQGAGLTNVYTGVELGAGAGLGHAGFNAAGNQSILIDRLDVDQCGDSRLGCDLLDLGARIGRRDVNVYLNQPGAVARLGGVMLVPGRRHVDQHLCAHHRAANCSSRQRFRAIGAGHGRGVFNTKAVVAQGADGSEVDQNSANMLLSPDAEIDTKPELEIYADEVQASHGATIGRIDEDAMYYLRCRGLDREQARQLLLQAFVNTAIEAIPDDALRARALQRAATELEKMQ